MQSNAVGPRQDGQLAHEDPVFLSPHEFIGGPGTPGVLVVKKALLRNRVPSVPGGGTVVDVVFCVSLRQHPCNDQRKHRGQRRTRETGVQSGTGVGIAARRGHVRAPACCRPMLRGAPRSVAALLAAAIASATAHAQSRAVTIGASGDVLAHLRVVAAAEHAEQGWDHVLGDLASIVTPDEIAFANLETPLSMQRAPRSGEPPVLGAPEALARALARAGIDVLSLANNHGYDQYASGAAHTRAAVEAAGIAAIGAGPDLAAAFAPRVLERDGVRVAFVALTERVNGGPGSRTPAAVLARWTDDATVAAALRRARADADLLVVSIHWSHDFWTEPTGAQGRRAAFLVEHGADLVLGHGPHVLHPVQRLPSPRGEALCAYSLGNLLSNQGMRYRAGRASFGLAHRATWEPGSRDGVWLRATLELEGGRVRVARVQGVPLFTYNNYFARLAGTERHEDIRVQRLGAVADAALRDERRRAIARALGPLVELLD